MKRAPRGVGVAVAALLGLTTTLSAHAVSTRETSPRADARGAKGTRARSEGRAREREREKRVPARDEARERPEPRSSTSDRDLRPARTTATKEREERRISLVRTTREDDSREARDGKEGKDAKTKGKAKKRERPVRPLPPGATWTKYRAAPWKRGYVTVTGHGKKWSGYLVDAAGDVIPGARRAVSEALASWRTGRQMLMDERLLQLIADVSDEFGGRPVRIVSGYREHSYAPDSKHKTGEAFDFSVPGVPNELLRDFLKSFPDVGVGFYPNSTHVHLDVRDKKTYWVDYSRPGEHPVYAYAKRQRGHLTPQERALASALDAIAAHPLRAERLSKLAPRDDDKRSDAPVQRQRAESPPPPSPARSRGASVTGAGTAATAASTRDSAPDGGAPHALADAPDAGRAATFPDAGAPARGVIQEGRAPAQAGATDPGHPEPGHSALH